MNKKTIILILSGLALLALSGVFYYEKKHDKQARDNGYESETSENGREAIRKYWESEEETSLDKIDQAFFDKRLDYEKSLIYKAYAIFGDERLPKEYQSGEFNFASNAALYEMGVKFDSLSKEAQEALKPFFLRPDDPESYLNLRYNKKTSLQKGLIKTARADRPDGTLYTDFLVSADNKVKIWYPNDTVDAYSSVWEEDGAGIVITSVSVSKAMAEKIKKFLDNDNIMKRYLDLLGRDIKKDGSRGGDDKLDIYVAPAGTNLGVSYGESATPCSSYILINISIGDKRDTILKTVLAHEIFHSFQYAYKYDAVKDNWWGEATAVWSEDFIYPDADTEQERLPRFFKYPEAELVSEKPPVLHHYAAYIFPYFITKKFGNDFMKKSWEGCDGKDCLKSMDEIISGGFKEQWREFTLWNYNKEPAKFYTDQKGFSKVSGESAKSKEAYLFNGDYLEINLPEVRPLSARLSDVADAQEDKSIKRVVFGDLKKFTGQSDKAALKALVYYKNGKKEIEDWTGKSERSFCIENKDEDFSQIVLIASNGDMKKKTGKAIIKIQGKPSCYHISQEDKKDAIIHFPYADSGAMKKIDIASDVIVVSRGEQSAAAEEGQKYAYLGKWKLGYEFEQIRKSFTVSCGGSNAIFDAGWKSRSAGYLEFDLKLKDQNAGEGEFDIDMTYGLPHPHGNYEEVPAIKANCISAYIKASSMNLAGIKGTMKNVYKGRIYDIGPDGAKLEIRNSCLYDGCTMATGEPFQTMDKIILEIRK